MKHALHRYFVFVISILLGVSVFTACQSSKSDSPGNLSSMDQKAANAAFESFTNELFRDEISSNTINLHFSLENPAALGITDYEISLGDFSKETRESASQNLLDVQSMLSKHNYEKLSTENQLTYDILMDFLDTQLLLCEYSLYQEPLSFSGGLQMELPVLFAEYEFTCEQDVKDYLKLLALTDEYFNQVMSFEAEKSDNSFFMSLESCNRLIESCKDFLVDLEHHYLVSSFDTRLQELDISDQKKASYTRQNQAILEKQLFPAYQNMIMQLEELKPSCTKNQGLCYLPEGVSFYESLVYSYTGCADSMDVLFRRIENQRMADLLNCSQLHSKNEDLIEECSFLEWEMASPDAMLASLQTAILNDFPKPPNCNYEINYVDPALEEYMAPAFYIVAPLDNFTENVIYINDGYISSDIYAFTTLAHEGYPGHLYQTVMSYTYDLPMIRSILNYPGYVEGWATYIEMMSFEYAGLPEDVAQFLSHNQSSALSLYASSDSGLHYYGWSIEEMYYFWAGYGVTDTAAINEITQLILSEPGNYLKYYIGYLEFLELKEYAKELFGTDYSEKQFHQAILDIGPASFSILKKYLPKYYSPQT